MRTFLLIAIILLSGILDAHPNIGRASIRQIVETRNGHRSCWGVVIYLAKPSFNKSLAANDLSIVEAKYSSELKDLMTWYVDKSRRKLFIKFKKGYGDFGTGNKVEVTIKASALVGSQKENIKLLISTDI